MRSRRLLPGLRSLPPALRLLLPTLALGLLLVPVPAPGAKPLRRHRLKRMSVAAEMQSFPVRGIDAFDPATPVLDDGFDPGDWDQISVAGKGRVLAYASRLSGGALGETRDVILLRESSSETETVSGADGDDDQPCMRFDKLGSRVAYRAVSADESVSNIFISSTTRGPDGGDTENRNITRLGEPRGSGGDVVDGLAFDPSLLAKTRGRDVGGGIEVLERDARLAFVSTADLDQGGRPPLDGGVGENPDNLPQLFLWQERVNKFAQLTHHTDPVAEVNRPSISGTGQVIAFESTADLVPDGVNPLDALSVGNAGGHRQIYVWTLRRGIRQITWGERDSFAPRIDRKGRAVLFCSAADLVPGGNPENNFEIFRWIRTKRPGRRLRQLTQVVEGHNVLPRPSAVRSNFTFYSSAFPPGIKPTDGGPPSVFGEGAPQNAPQALIWVRGGVRRIHGTLDAANVSLFPPQFTGPPAVGTTVSKIEFCTNDQTLDSANARASANAFHMARGTRFRAKKR